LNIVIVIIIIGNSYHNALVNAEVLGSVHIIYSRKLEKNWDRAEVEVSRIKTEIS